MKHRESQSDLSNVLRKLSDWSHSYQSGFGLAIQQATQDIKQYFRAELGPFKDDIQKLVEGQHIKKENLQATQDKLLEHIQPISQQLADLVPHTKATMKGMEFLKKLSFGEIRTRHEGITMAHAETFEWVFKQRTPDDLHAVHFVNWLKSGSGIYWVRGKPGSGKSTLMKFLRPHQETVKSLLAWSRGEKLVISTHFFWNAGSDLQKSQLGLYRTLLFDILLQCPEMISDVEQLLGSTEDPYNPWSPSVLCSALQLVTTDLPVRFCFFIDGLDEYEGTHAQLIEVIKKIALSPKIKICASSRPWTCFLDAFGDDPLTSLRLEELTASDIRKFVDDRFGGNPHFRKYRHNSEYTSLVNEVVSRADGVFLWVDLVVKSLLEGFSYSDRIPDLRRRLESLPTDLESYFQHILKTVQEFYQRQSARTFLFALHAPGTQHTVLYSAADFIDGDSARVDEISYDLIDFQTVQDSAEEITRRLDARSKGLLEVTDQSDHLNLPVHERFRVGFLHRTVRDWLQNKESDIKRQAGPDFDVRLAIAQASAAMLKPLMRSYPAAMCENKGTNLFEQLHIIMSYLGSITPEAEKQGVVLLDSLAKILSSSVLGHRLWPKTTYWSGPELLLRLAVEHRILWYVKSRVEREPILCEQTQYQLLADALNIESAPMLVPGKAVCLDLVKFLLDGHADPNCRLPYAATLWITFLAQLTVYRGTFQSQLQLDHSQTVELLAMLVAADARVSDVSPKMIADIRGMFSPKELRHILGDQHQSVSSTNSSVPSKTTNRLEKRPQQSRNDASKAASLKKGARGTRSGFSTGTHSRKPGKTK